MQFLNSKIQTGLATSLFSNDGRHAYIVHELSNEVSVTEYQDGKFIELERHSTIPSDFNGESKLAADYHMMGSTYI